VVARLKHYLEYAAASSIAAIARTLRPEAADRLGAFLGTVAFNLIKSRRQVSNDNIRGTIGQNLTDVEIEEITKSVFQNIGRTLTEIVRFQNLGQSGVLKILHGDPALIKKIYGEGKGGIILTAHYGNWELLGGWPAALGYPIDFLVGTQHNQLVDELLNSCRRKLGAGIIPLENSLRGIFKALKSNHFVGIAGDQHAAAGIKLKFLGKYALHARGPALFSIRTGAPILPMMLRRENFNRHVAYSAEPIYPNQSADEESEITRITETSVRFFEDFIRKYPDQWAWTHRRWKL
ncbi:MAG: lysophospholipid acyltransferase family protein, partial [Candidatus Zixiibacteriota bacterium]